jgi:hypothetical protein
LSSQGKSQKSWLSEIGKGSGKGLFAPESLKKLLIVLVTMAIVTAIELVLLNLLFT